jgi:hypothetical protein
VGADAADRIVYEVAGLATAESVEPSCARSLTYPSSQGRKPARLATTTVSVRLCVPSLRMALLR